MLNVLRQNTQVSNQLLNQAQSSLEQFLNRQDIGFHHLPERSALWVEAAQMGKQLRQEFENMVVVGIGGSSLGPKALYEALYEPTQKHKIFFCENVDALEFQRIRQQIDLKKTVWVFISKSGTTLETLVTADYVIADYKKQNLSLSQYFRVISEKKSSPLADWATKNKIAMLEIPLDVGGRFSVLSPVGMLPAEFMGWSAEKFRAGAKQALQDKKNVSLMMAQAYQSFEREEWISFFWFYSSLLRTFGAWLQQLWAESLAKKAAPRASTPLAAVGACDQHSLLQQVMEGAKDKWVVFLRVKACENAPHPLSQSEFPAQSFVVGRSMGEVLAAEAQATYAALSENKVSALEVQLPDLSPESLGYLFMYWQLVVAGLGEMMKLNAFDQPGVELGKKLAKDILKSYN